MSRHSAHIAHRAGIAALDQRLAWITAYERCGNAADVCRRHGISRATLRKWWRRYEAEGIAGLAERSRAPVHSPSRKVIPAQREAVLALRGAGLGFGRIRDRLARDSGIDLSVSTIRRIIARADPAWRPPAPAPPAQSPPEGLASTTPPEGVAAQLAEAIHAGHFRPGEKLAEEALARRFGAGRTRIRDALRSLAFLGVVRIERNRGAFVARPSDAEIASAYEARRVIEAGIVSDIGRLAPAQAETLRRHVATQAAAEAAGQRVRLVQLLTEFHLVLAGMSGNHFLRGFLEQLTATTSLAVLLYDRAAPPCCAVQEHADLVDHLARGESAAAVALMLRHLGANEARLGSERCDEPARRRAANAARRA